MDIIILLSGSNSRNSGGLFNSVKSLAFSLKKNSSSDVSIASYDDEFSNIDRLTYKNIKLLVYKLKGLKQLGYSPNLSYLLEGEKPDIIHQQGIWMLYSLNTLKYKQKNKNTTVVISPRGMLDPWILKNSKWKKELAKIFYENSNLKNADCIHALCQSEFESIRNYGLKNPVAIIPNGIDLPDNFIRKNKTGNNKKTLLFISRIHPKKGLKFLIEVFNIIKNEEPTLLENWKFIIAGWSQAGHQEELMLLCNKYDLNHIIEFVGPVYGKEKEEQLINADAFILPSYSEGLPMSILEAWSYKLPVVMTEQCNIPDGFSNNAALLINHKIPETVNKMKEIFKLSDSDLIKIGENGYELVKNKYTWDIIGKKTLQLYKWLRNKKNEKPDFILLN